MGAAVGGGGSSLRPHHSLDGVSGHVVEEESEEDGEEEDDDCFKDNPFIIMPQDVFDGFQRTQEPDEGGVGPTEKIKMMRLSWRCNRHILHVKLTWDIKHTQSYEHRTIKGN